jgi:hypothetical protein
MQKLIIYTKKLESLFLLQKIQLNIAPQKLQRRCRHAKQQSKPIGKKKMAQQRPKNVKSVSNMPT